jgi:hypothetical protein
MAIRHALIRDSSMDTQEIQTSYLTVFKLQGSQMKSNFFPNSFSIHTFFTVFADPAKSFLPTAVDPVNVIFLTYKRKHFIM